MLSNSIKSILVLQDPEDTHSSRRKLEALGSSFQFKGDPKEASFSGAVATQYFSSVFYFCRVE